MSESSFFLRMFGPIAIACLVAAHCRADEPTSVAWSETAVARFATRAQARTILGADDGFLRACSRFDIASRMKTTQDVDRQEFAAWLADDALEWDEPTRKLVEGAVVELRPKLESLAHPIPRDTSFVLTAGRSESGAPYTRGSTIVLTRSAIGGGGEGLRRLLLHELFHVISCENPELRKKLYQSIGFAVHSKIAPPRELAGAKITNPDAPWWDCALTATVDGRETLWTPIITASPEVWSPEKGRSLFDYLRFRFLEVESTPDGNEFRAVRREGNLSLREPTELPEFARAIGRNTTYVIHPDEILADNFIHMALETPDLPSPEVVNRMREAWPKSVE